MNALEASNLIATADASNINAKISARILTLFIEFRAATMQGPVEAIRFAYNKVLGAGAIEVAMTENNCDEAAMIAAVVECLA